MSRNDIKEKLQSILDKDVLEETDVIYILSRIRKLLEIDRNKTDFKILNFYCNWALHAQIDDTDFISKILENLGTGMLSLMHFYLDFDKEFKKFLSKHKLTTKIFLNNQTLTNFHHILSEIYSDTPLIVKTIRKKKITFTKLESFDKNSGFFSARCEEI